MSEARNLLRKWLGQRAGLPHRTKSALSAAEARSNLPAIGSKKFPKPHGTDWSWRPTLWRSTLSKPGTVSVQNGAKLGSELKLFHDCPRAEICLRQIRNRGASDLAPYGLNLEVFGFEGSFLSLVLDLPQDVLIGLKKRHLIRLNTIVDLEMPMEIFARLNIKNGPNTEQVVRSLAQVQSDVTVEFDLGNSGLNEKRLEGAWIDLIFKQPQMNRVTVRDLNLCRYPRAEV